jgi:glucose/arabinose dehydrogenase
VTRLRLFAVLVFGAGGVAAGAGFQAGHSWPPPVQRVSDQSPVLSPAEELKTIVMPPGYHLALVASEPLIQDPVVIDWDSDGRLWAIEMPGYMPDIQANHEHDPIGRVVVLQDMNGDGRMDKRTVFADGLTYPNGVLPWKGGLIVTCSPDRGF